MPEPTELTDTLHSIHMGVNFPYDASDVWWNTPSPLCPPPAKDWAHLAARGVVASLEDRRGIKRGFAEINEDIRVEIVESIAAIIRLAHKQETDRDRNGPSTPVLQVPI